MAYTEDEYAQLMRQSRKALALPPKAKYGNIRCEVDGQKFDSKHEAQIWMDLRARQAAGEISELHRQMPFALYTADADGVRLEVAHYIADYVWVESERRVVADAKSKATKTQVYLLKKRWLFLQDGIEIQEL